MIKSGPVVFSSGERGVFITEQDLGRGGDAFRYFVQTNYKKAMELDGAGYNVISVMWHLLNSQYDDAINGYTKRQLIEVVNNEPKTITTNGITVNVRGPSTV